jgi:hypothetical protein
MRKLFLVSRSTGAIAIAALIVACEDPVTRLPARPSPLALAGIEISGPDRVAPGAATQFTALIRLADGTKKAASADTRVQWTTSDGQLLRVDASGLVTAQQRMGDATLSASVARGGGASGTFQSAKEVTVLPDGTFRVVGTVRDAELPTLTVFGARVEVTPGPLTTTTGFDGRYTLYGVPADAELRITRDGYEPSVQHLQLTANATRDFQLTPTNGPRPTPSGPFTLAVDITGTCTGLPPDLQHRRYEAVITLNGTTLEVKLTEPRFKLSGGQGNRFFGRLDATGATFFLSSYFSYYYYYYSDLAEQLPDGTVLEIWGQVTMRATTAGMSGQLSPYGGINHWDSGFPTNARYLGGCATQSAIVLTLTPR